MFSNKSDLQAHYDSMRNIEQYSCDTCYYQTGCKISLKFHIESIHKVNSEQDLYDLIIEPQIIKLLENNGHNPNLILSPSDELIEFDDSLIILENLVIDK